MPDQPASYATRMWDLAADMLGSRNHVGKLVKTYGEPLTMSVIGGIAAMRNPPADLRAYVTAVLDKKLKQRGQGPRPVVPDFVPERKKLTEDERRQGMVKAAEVVAMVRGKLR